MVLESMGSLLSSLYIYIPTILFVTILLFAAFTGIRRGFRKSLLLFINMIIALGVCTLVYLLLFNDFDTSFVYWTNKVMGLFHISIGSLLNMDDYTSITGYASEFFAKNASIPAESVAEYVRYALVFAEVILKFLILIVLLVLYIIIKFILYIIYLIFFKEGRKKRKMERKYQAGLSQKRYNKNAFGGFFVGLLRGTIKAVVIFSFIGGLFSVITGGNYSTSKEDKIEVSFNEKEYNIAPMYNAINAYGSVGVGKVLESFKNSENVPVYLLISDYITSGTFKYDEEREETIYLRQEFVSFTGFIKECALIYLHYGFDPNSANDANYLIDFLYSDNTYNGLTVIESLDNAINQFSLGKFIPLVASSLISNVMTSVVTIDYKKYDTRDALLSSTEFENADATQKMLYFAFAGENRIKEDSIVTTENVRGLLHVCLDCLKGYPILNKMVVDNNITLVNITDSELQECKTIGKNIIDDFSSMSIFTSNNLDNLLTEFMVVLVSNFMPDISFYDLINSCKDKAIELIGGFEDLLNTAYDVAIYSIDNVINEGISLSDFLISDLAKEDSKTIPLLKEICNTKIINEILNMELGIKVVNQYISQYQIEIPSDTKLAPYEDETGSYDGELINLVTLFAPYSETIINGIKNNDYKNLIVNLSNGDDAPIKKLVNTSSKSYSKLVHSLTSQLIISYSKSNDMIYVPSVSLDDSNYIKSDELLTILNVAAKFINIDENFDYMTLLDDEEFMESLKTSYIIKASVAINLSTNFTTLPDDLVLDEEHREENIDNWIKVDGEVDSLIDILNYSDPTVDINFKSILKDENQDLIKLIRQIHKSNDAAKVLVSSKILATELKTNILNISLDDSKVTIPSADLDSNGLIKADAINDLSLAIDSLLDENSNNFEDIKYSKLLESETAKNVLNSKTIYATISVIMKNKLTTTSTDGIYEYVSLPTSLKNDDNIETNFISSKWVSRNSISLFNSSESELYYFFQGLKYMGVSITDTLEFDFDESKIFNLSKISEDLTNTNLTLANRSLIIQSMISNILNTNDIILVPTKTFEVMYKEDKIIKDSELNLFFSALDIYFPEEEGKNRTLDDLSNIKLSNYQEDSLRSDILNATLALKVNEVKDIEIPTKYIISKDNLSYLENWLYQDDENKGETIHLMNSLNELGLLEAIDSSKDIDFDSTFRNHDFDFTSDVLWMTVSETVRGLQTLIITDEIYETDFTTRLNMSGETIIKIDELNKLKTDINSLNENSESLGDFKVDDVSKIKEFSSSIIRNSISEQFLNKGLYAKSDCYFDTTLNGNVYYSLDLELLNNTIKLLNSVGFSYDLDLETVLKSDNYEDLIENEIIYFYVAHKTYADYKNNENFEIEVEDIEYKTNSSIETMTCASKESIEVVKKYIIYFK